MTVPGTQSGLAEKKFKINYNKNNFKYFFSSFFPFLTPCLMLEGAPSQIRKRWGKVGQFLFLLLFSVPGRVWEERRSAFAF